jgi:dihydroorotate dehydrogenase
MKKWILVIIFASTGLLASAVLVPSYLSDSEVEFCLTGSDSGGSGCDVVKDSKYSSLLGIPLPVWGVLFYAFLIICSVAGIFAKDFTGKIKKIFKIQIDFIAASWGFIFSLYLTYIEAFVLETWCSYCVMQAIAAVLIFVTYMIFSPYFYIISYKYFLKRILFLIDPEKVHDLFTRIGSIMGRYKFIRSILKEIFRVDNEKLKTSIGSVNLPNPVGLSAGFDYNGKLTEVLGSVGFGFESVGTVTFNIYEGNRKPRLGRLKRSQALLVNKGFKSEGIKKVLDENVKFTDPDLKVGVSVGATNSPETSTVKKQIEDILKSFEFLKKHKSAEEFAYYELNISCPNVLGSGTLANPEDLEDILQKITRLGMEKPLFVKFQLEIEWEEAKKLIEIMIKYSVTAIVLANLAKDRTNPDFDKHEIKEVENLKGNFSGKPTWNLSNELIGKIYKEFGDKIKIIGAGGIFDAQDAYTKIKLGASAVQLITGMIYNGPATIYQINSGLVKLLEADEYKNISEAVGKGGAFNDG